jgi:hypothetical protein
MMLRCIQPSASITVDPGHPVTSLWLVPLLLGAAAVLIGAGMALAAGQGLLTAVRHPPGGASIAAYLAIGVLAAATMRAGLDLRAATSS